MTADEFIKIIRQFDAKAADWVEVECDHDDVQNAVIDWWDSSNYWAARREFAFDEALPSPLWDLIEGMDREDEQHIWLDKVDTQVAAFLLDWYA